MLRRDGAARAASALLMYLFNIVLSFAQASARAAW
jgi:hypothetical protein